MATKLQKRTAELMLKKLEAKLNNLYEEQESSKTPKQKQSSEQKMPWGGALSAITNNLNNSGILSSVIGNSSAQNSLMNFPTDSIPASGTGLMDIPMVGQGGGYGPSNIFNNFAQGFKNNDWVNTGLSALGTAPMLYNLFQGSRQEEQLNPQDFYNPYENEIRSTMRGRRFNIDPILQSNLAAQQTYNQNIRNSGALGSGALRSNYLAGSAQRQLADAAAYSQKSNIDNQYLAQQAQMDAQLGSQRAQTKLGIQDINDRNEAARRNYLAQGFSDVSNWAQTQQLIRNQRAREPMYADILNTYNPYSQNYFSTFYNKLKRKSVND